MDPAQFYEIDHMAEQHQQQIQIRASDADLKGVYSNSMRVTHTQEEFILDFFNITPPTGILASRVILSPGHLKRVMDALQDNMKKYEERFGKIQPAEGPQGGEIGFRV